MIGSRCDVCDSPKTGACRACEGVRATLWAAGVNSDLITDWVQAVARKAAEDADERHEERRHNG